VKIEATVRTNRVVVINEDRQRLVQVGHIADQDPVQALGPCRGYPVGLENAIQLDDLRLSVEAWGGKAAM
jgi:hypothetical protein